MAKDNTGASETFGLEGFAALSEADQKAVAALASKAAEADKRAEAAEKTVDTQKKLIDKLNSSVSSKSSKNDKPTFKLGKEVWELVVPSSTLNGKPINAMTLSDNSEQLKQLVKIKSGVIRKVD